MIREKKTISGKLLEADFYPIFADGRKMQSRAPKTKPSTAEQERYNQKQATKRFIRLVNANFETGDQFVHVTYDPEHAPFDEEKAKNDMRNFFRRVKTKRAAELKRVLKLLEAAPDDEILLEKKRKLEESFRYAYVLEEKTYKSGSHKGKSNYHAHIFMTGGLDRDMVEDLWGLGVRVNADRLQLERFGPEAAAKYCAKDPKGKKRFYSSRNLKKPITPKPKDGKITPGYVAKLAQKRVDDAAYWENRYKGYKFIRCYSRYNEFNGYWYVSVVMYKNGDAPPWDMDDSQERALSSLVRFSVWKKLPFFGCGA